MGRFIRIACVCCAATLVLASSAAMGQREQFPSVIPTPGPAASPSPEPGPPPTYAPSFQPAPYGAPAPAPALPPDAGMYAPPPTATLNGTIQPPPPTWDPYAAPGVGQPGLMPGNYLQLGPGVSFAQVQRFLQEVRVDYHYFPAMGSQPLGINDLELTSTFALPFLYNRQTPLLITPGFAAHFWNGPNSTGPEPADMPPETFDAYLDAAWNPQVNQWFGGELDGRVGVYSDFRGIDVQSIRVTGSGLAVITFNETLKVKFGVWYLDRVEYKLFPAGGVVWSPNPDVRFDVLFPNPKFSQRLTTYGDTEWWWYLSGLYGGGAWTIKRGMDSPLSGSLDLVDYNDIRIAVGLEFKRPRGLTGLFEIGGAFDRQLDYTDLSPPTYRPSNTMFLRGSLAY